MGRVQLRVNEGKGVAESINYISGFITHNNNNPRTVHGVQFTGAGRGVKQRLLQASNLTISINIPFTGCI